MITKKLTPRKQALYNERAQNSLKELGLNATNLQVYEDERGRICASYIIDGKIYTQSLLSLSRMCRPKELYSSTIRLRLQEVNQRIYDKLGARMVVEEYIDNAHPASFRCLECNYIFQDTMSKLRNHVLACPKCRDYNYTAFEQITLNALDASKLNYTKDYTLSTGEESFKFTANVDNRFLVLALGRQNYYVKEGHTNKVAHIKLASKIKYCLDHKIIVFISSYSEDFINIEYRLLNANEQANDILHKYYDFINYKQEADNRNVGDGVKRDLYDKYKISYWNFMKEMLKGLPHLIEYLPEYSFLFEI